MSWFKRQIQKRIIRAVFDSKLGKLVFGWANGYKTILGRLMGLTTVILVTIQSHFPEYAIIADVNAIWLMISAIIVTELGIEHKEVKSDE